MRSEAESLLVNFATSNIVRLAEKYTEHGAKYLQDAGQIDLLEWRIIVWLERIIEPTLVELSSSIRSDQNLLEKAVKGLIERGLIDQITDEDNNTRFALTEAGDALFDKVYPVMEQRQRMLIEDEDPDEMALFMNMLHRLEAKVDACMPQSADV